MNVSSVIFSSIYSQVRDYSFSEMESTKLVQAAALVAIGLVAISYQCLQRKCRTIKRPLPGNLFGSFEYNYRERMKLGYHNSPCPSMKMFKKETSLLEAVLTRWRLDSELRFFDLLGFDIYDGWKREHGSPEDLSRFCESLKRLSIKVHEFSDHPPPTSVFDVIYADFQFFESRIPESLKPKFNFLLKILNHPPQALALGLSPVHCFDKTEILDGDHSNPEDIRAFLDFAYQMHPEELGFIRSTSEDMRLLSKKLAAHEKKLEISRTALSNVQADLKTFISNLRRIIDTRVFQRKILVQRLFMSVQLMDLFEGTHKQWIHKKFKQYLGEDFESQVLQYTLKNKDGTKAWKENSLHPEMVDRAITYLIANQHKSHSLKPIEAEILKVLDKTRELCKDPEEYAFVFFEMILFYQIIHDIQVLKDSSKDSLDGRNIPESFTERVFLPQIDSSLPRVAREDPVPFVCPPLETNNFPLVVNDSPLPKVKTKTRVQLAKTTENDDKRDPIAASASPMPISQDLPYFPHRNASGAEVMSLLLNNGFMIRRVTGSHYQMRHVTSLVSTTVPFHGSISVGALSHIREAFYASQGHQGPV